MFPPMSEGGQGILLVEDDPDHATLINRAFETESHCRLVITTSLAQAKSLINHTPPDLVITDMSMPNMSGDILSAELMKVRPEIPVILCTGYSSNISKQSAMGIGIKAFVHKPVDRVNLAKLIREILDE